MNTERSGTLDFAAACRVCGSAARTLVSTDVYDAPESQVYKCGGCDVVYLDPIMSGGTESAFYEDEFPTYMEGRNQPGGKDPQSHFEAFAGEGARRVDLLAHHLDSSARVLEIGSATGYLLEALAPRVGSVTGVEPGERFREFARSRGIDTVASVDALGGRFDAILMYYLVEHIRDPVRFLRGVGEYLAPGGRLFIEVPNVDDVLLSTYPIPAFPPFYWQRAHYFNYSHRTLADVLARAGFATEIYPVQRYDLSNHMVWMTDGTPGGKGRYAHLFDATLERAYADCLKRAWVCDTVFAVARRQEPAP